MRNNRHHPLKRRAHKILRLCALCLAAGCVLCLIAAQVLDISYHRKRNDIAETRRDALRAIVRELEFSGLSEDVTGRMAEHSATYTDFSNFIVVDNSFKVLYSLNQGLLDGTGYFYGIIANDNYTGLICDKDGNVISQHTLNTDDGYGLGRLSVGFAAYPRFSPGPEGEGTVSAYASEDAVYDTGVLAWGGVSVRYIQESGVVMYYAGIPSKNLNLFFMYDDDTPKWTQHLAHGEDWIAGFQVLSMLCFLLYWFALAAWVFIDAAQREHHPALWGVLALFTNAVGLIVYLVVRPERPACKSCGEPLVAGYIVCPVCGTRHKDQCPSCRRIIEEKWLHCPYCGSALKAAETAGPDASPAGET